MIRGTEAAAMAYDPERSTLAPVFAGQ